MQARGVDYARERPPTRQIYSTIPAPSFHAPTSYPGAQTHSNPAWSPLPTPHHAYPLLSAQYPYHNSSTHSWTAPRPTQTQTQHFPRQFLESPKSATEPNHPVASNSLLRGVLGVMPTKRRRVIVKLPIKGSSEPEAECGGVEGLAAGGIASTAGDRRIPLRGDDRQEVARKMDVDEFRFATERATTRGPHRDELRQVQLPPTIDIYLPGKSSWLDVAGDIAELALSTPPILQQLSEIIAAAPLVDIFSPLPSPSFLSSSFLEPDDRASLPESPFLSIPIRLRPAADSARSFSTSSFTSIGTVLRTFAPPPVASPTTTKNGRSLTLEELTRGFGLDAAMVLSPGMTTWIHSTSKERRTDHHSSPSTSHRRRQQNHSYSSDEGAYDGSDSNRASSGVEDALGEDETNPAKGQHKSAADFIFPPRSPLTPISKFSSISPTTIRQRPLDPAVDDFVFGRQSDASVGFPVDESPPPTLDGHQARFSTTTHQERHSNGQVASALLVTPPKPNLHTAASSRSETSHMDSPFSVRLATIVGQQPTSSAMSVSRSLPIQFGPPLLDRRGSLADYSPSISRPRAGSMVNDLTRAANGFSTNGNLFQNPRHQWTNQLPYNARFVSPPPTNPSDSHSSPPSSPPSEVDEDEDDTLPAPIQVLGDFIAQQFDSLRDQFAESLELMETGIPETLELFCDRLADLLADSRTLDEEGREAMLVEMRLSRVSHQDDLASRTAELSGEVAALERRLLHQDQRIAQLQIDKIELRHAAAQDEFRYALLESRLAQSEKTRLDLESALRNRSSSSSDSPTELHRIAIASMPSPPASPEVHRSHGASLPSFADKPFINRSQSPSVRFEVDSEGWWSVVA